MKFCPGCGGKVAGHYSYCPSCGTGLDELKGNRGGTGTSRQLTLGEAGLGMYPDETGPGGTSGGGRTSLGYAALVIAVGVAVVILCFMARPPEALAFSGLQTMASTPEVPVIQNITPYEKNVQAVKEIAQEYASTHTYMGVRNGHPSDIYVCVDMAMDVWNMIETRGMNAAIYIGNIDRAVSQITDANHAWVLAEVGPGQWLAVETTGGFTVTQAENALYYKGWKYDTPSDLKRLSCGGTYCFSGTCLNGKCARCEQGYTLGTDLQCHPQCGLSYCTGDSICVNGGCRGCGPGYVPGDDLQCHKVCGDLTTYCTGDSVCSDGRCVS